MDCNGAISAVNRVIISIVLTKTEFPYPGEVARNIFQKALPSGQLVMAALVSVNRCNKSDYIRHGALVVEISVYPTLYSTLVPVAVIKI